MKQAAEPSRESKRGVVLSYVRRHPNCLTSEVVIGAHLPLKDTKTILLWLLDNKLVGRQRGLDYHEYESRWVAEATPVRYL